MTSVIYYMYNCYSGISSILYRSFIFLIYLVSDINTPFAKYLSLLTQIFEWAYPNPIHYYDNTIFAKMHYFLFFFIIIAVLSVPIYGYIRYKNILLSVVLFNSNVTLIVSGYVCLKLAGMIAVLIIVLFFLMSLVYYHIEQWTFHFETPLFILLDILAAVEILLTVLMGFFLYCSYFFLIQSYLTNTLDALVTLQLCSYIFCSLFIIIILSYLLGMQRYAYYIFSIVYLLIELIFFNTILSYILGPLLYISVVNFAAFYLGCELPFCLLLTVIYALFLIDSSGWPLNFSWLNICVLVSLTGLALGARLGFRTAHAWINLCFYDFNFFFLSFCICLLILVYVYAFFWFFCEIFFTNESYLNFFNYLIVLVLLFILFFFIGIFITICCIYTSYGLVIPFSTFTIFL